MKMKTAKTRVTAYIVTGLIVAVEIWLWTSAYITIQEDVAYGINKNWNTVANISRTANRSGGGSPDTPTVTGLVLYDAETDQPIQPIASGETIDLADIPTRSIAIIATTAGPVESIRFSVNKNATIVIDNVPYYTVYGDASNQNITTWDYTLGLHSAVIIPYSRDNAGGFKGQAKLIQFNLIDSAN